LQNKITFDQFVEALKLVAERKDKDFSNIIERVISNGPE
jgi:hypothetical protein